MLQAVTFEEAVALTENVEVVAAIVPEHNFGGLAPLVDEIERKLDRRSWPVDRARDGTRDPRAVLYSYRHAAERARCGRRDTRSPHRGDVINTYLR